MEEMAGYTSELASTCLYNCVSQKVAHVDQVKTIRIMNSVRDNLGQHDKLRITSGSFGEGLELNGSDSDIVYVWKGIEVFENESLIQMNPNTTYFALETDNVKPGIAHLRLVDTNRLRVFENCVLLKRSLYYSSELIKKLFICKTHPINHGPCVTTVGGHSETASAVHCKSWISSASHWIHRSKNSWPSAEIKQCIVDHGILFVPIGIKGSQNEFIEWRISFTVGERFLMFSFNHTQLLCYVLLKWFFAGIADVYPIFNEFFCSYFIKTIMFWLSEELPPSIWKPENLLSCSIICMNRVIYCVKYLVCPHYFIPENNMYENKISGAQQVLLLEYFNPTMWQEFLNTLIGISFHTLNETQNNTSVLFIDMFQRMIKSKLLARVGRYNHNYYQVIKKILSCKSSRMKPMYLYNLSMICNDALQLMEENSSYRSNKSHYKLCKKRMFFLLQSIHHDAISGWLMMASMAYREKQYNKSISILDYALSKCTSEKTQLGSKLSDMQKDILKLTVFQKKGIIRSLNFLFMGCTKFYKFSDLIPEELEMEVDDVCHVLPPVVYAHFLYFLCYYHSYNVQNCLASLQNLKQSILKNMFIPDIDSSKAASYNVLGIALHIAGDKESALKAFKDAVAFDPNPIFHCAAQRAKMLNQPKQIKSCEKG